MAADIQISMAKQQQCLEIVMLRYRKSHRSIKFCLMLRYRSIDAAISQLHLRCKIVVAFRTQMRVDSTGHMKTWIRFGLLLQPNANVNLNTKGEPTAHLASVTDDICPVECSRIWVVDRMHCQSCGLLADFLPSNPDGFGRFTCGIFSKYSRE